LAVGEAQGLDFQFKTGKKKRGLSSSTWKFKKELGAFDVFKFATDETIQDGQEGCMGAGLENVDGSGQMTWVTREL